MKVQQHRFTLLPEYIGKVILGNPGIGKSYLCKYSTTLIIDADEVLLSHLKTTLETYSSYKYYFPTVNAIKYAAQAYNSNKYSDSPSYNEVMTIVGELICDSIDKRNSNITVLLANPSKPFINKADFIFLQPNEVLLKKSLYSEDRKNIGGYSIGNIPKYITMYKQYLDGYEYHELKPNEYISDIICYKEEA